MPPRRTSRTPATLTFRCDPKTRKLLQAVAETKRMSEGALVHLLVEEGLGRHDVLHRLDRVEHRLLVLESERVQHAAAEEEAASDPKDN